MREGLACEYADGNDPVETLKKIDDVEEKGEFGRGSGADGERRIWYPCGKHGFRQEHDKASH